ncbi:flagellar attachment zone protein 1-like [Gigaspora margarita]|uniref:Flagellar attachment zone protein 1-like n=1 Tax=Gigaspora margarita TaxID=4874 RepID=A0A8H4AGG7_GIGMA|nr:flagellar attachment zone protein 1-like [Gigaspora margarita]
MKGIFKNDKNEHTRSNSNPEEDGKSKTGVMSKLKSLRRKKDGSDHDRRSITEKNLDESLITKDDFSKSNDSSPSHRTSIISIGNNRVSVVEYDNLVKELEKVNHEKESIKQQAEKAKEELERRDSDIQSLKDELRSSKEVVEKLQKDTSLPTTPDRQSHDISLAVDNALHQELDRLKFELQQKDNVIDQLNLKLADSNEIISKVEKFQFELEEKDQLIKKLNDELQSRDDTIQNITTELNSNKQEIEKIKRDAFERSKSMTSESESNKVALEVNKHEIVNLKAALEKSNTIIQQLNSDVNTREKSIQSTTSALEKSQSALESSNEIIKNLKSEVERLTFDLNSIKNGSDKKVDLSEFEKSQNEINKLNSIIEETQHSLSLRNDDITNLSRDLENSRISLKESNEEIINLKSQFEKTQNELLSKIDDISNLKSNIQERDQTIQELRKNLQNATNDPKIIAERDSLKKDLQKIQSDFKTRSNELQQVNIALQSSNTEKQVIIEQHNQIKAELESTLKDLKNQINERDQKIQSMVSKDNFDSINKAYNDIKLELDTTKSELESKRNILADVSSVEELRAQLSAAKAEVKAYEWEKKRNESLISEKKRNESLILEQKNKIDNLTIKEKEDIKNRQQLEHKVQKLTKEIERLRNENNKLSESERQARDLITKKESPTINVIPVETTSTNKSNGLISERSIEPSSSKHIAAFVAPSPKRNNASEPLGTNGLSTIPQDNVQDQKNETKDNKNGVIPRPKKDDGNEGWITVKRRSMRQRNSMVMA